MRRGLRTVLWLGSGSDRIRPIPIASSREARPVQAGRIGGADSMLVQNPEPESPVAGVTVRAPGGRLRTRALPNLLPVESGGFYWRIDVGLLREIGTASRLIEAVRRPEP